MICTYQLDRFGGDTVIDVMRTHPMVIGRDFDLAHRIGFAASAGRDDADRQITQGVHR